MPTYTRGDNIKIDRTINRVRGLDWIGLDQDRNRWWAVVNAVRNFGAPLNADNFMTA